MTALLPRLLCLWLLAGTSVAVQFHKCPLARILQEGGLDGYGGIFLEEWMCIASYSSGYNTESGHDYDTESNQYTGYGLFQLNPRYWCKVPGYESQNNCNICCRKFLDVDLADDIKCLKQIARTTRRIHLFYPWQVFCKNTMFETFLNDCSQLNRRWKHIS